MTDREQYRAIVERNHDGVFIYQNDSFVFVNDRFCEIVGYDRQSLREMGLGHLLHSEDRERIAEFVDRRRSGEHAPNRYQARVRTDDGDVRHLSFSVNAITNDGEHAEVGSVRDVTERQQHEQRLEEFASIVAHDLRNPLNVIAGRIELARETGGDDHFDAISRGVSNMEELISDMRELASEGVPVHEAGVVDVAMAVRNAWTEVEGATELTVADGLPTIEADEDRLERFLLEVLENAAMYGGESVRVEPADGGFAVVDDGPGIEESERERVFEAGYTTDPERTGFGLAIVQWIADAHGWDLSIEAGDDGGVRLLVTGVTVV